MVKKEIVEELTKLVNSGIITKDDFWLSNKTALVMYEIKDSIDYIAINCRKNVLDTILKKTDYISRIERKKRIIDLKSNVLLYEDNRPCRYQEIEGFRVETIHSILSKKWYYSTPKSLKEAEEIQRLAKEKNII